MADFVTQHCGPKVLVLDPVPWTMFFDGSSCSNGAGVGILLISPKGPSYEFSLPIEAGSTNN